MNKVFFIRPKLKDLLSIISDNDFHSFFISTAIKNYLGDKKVRKGGLGTILAIGASHVEATNLIKYPFKKIVLTGITDPDEKTKEIIKKDKRVSYAKQNLECISEKSKSYDIVFCKEAIHHSAKPILGLYELLRICKKAVILIEPYETTIGKFLEKMGLSSVYEKNQKGNTMFRDNYVYRWNANELKKILNSYYLESGYKLKLINCWLSNRYNCKYPLLVKIFTLFGKIISFLPGNRGNYMTSIIYPGKNLPADSRRL